MVKRQKVEKLGLVSIAGQGRAVVEKVEICIVLTEVEIHVIDKPIIQQGLRKRGNETCLLLSSGII